MIGSSKAKGAGKPRAGVLAGVRPSASVRAGVLAGARPKSISARTGVLAGARPKSISARRSGTGAQLGLQFRTWGGARAGAGRPPSGARSGVSHLARAPLSRRHPAHVTLRVLSGVPSLREGALFFAVRRALSAGKARFGFRLVHFSVQRDHLHLLAEAEGRGALSRGIQGLAIRVARAVNRELGRRGRLFADRYHARALKTPREARLALRYVLMNARKHSRGRARLPMGFVDPCSSAPWFDDWARPREVVFGGAAEARPRELVFGGAAEARPREVVFGGAAEARPREVVFGGAAEARPRQLVFGGAAEAAAARPREVVFGGAAEAAAAPVVLPRTWLLRVGVARAGPIDPDDEPSHPP